MPQESVDASPAQNLAPEPPASPVLFQNLPLDPGTGTVAFHENNLATTAAQVAAWNSRLRDAYLGTTWPNYVENMQSGQPISADRRVPPPPPLAFVVSPPDSNGLVSPIVGTELVTPMPPVPVYLGGLQVPQPIPNNISINWATWRPGSAWVDANKDDGFPNGMVTRPIQAPDGTLHTYERFSEPMGGLYLQVS